MATKGGSAQTVQNRPEQYKEANLTYNAQKVTGNGSFGVVYRAIIQQTGQTVAIKKVFQDRRYKNRQLQIMKQLFHPNIISLRHFFYTSGQKQNEVYLNLVMDFINENAYRVMKFYFKKQTRLPLILVKLYTYQLMRSLAQCHSQNICHRDIKPHNLLIDTNSHILKLCDFGSAKRLIPTQNNVSYICSRYYRAPELIFGSSNYSFSIDIWSVGCVTAQMLLNRPIFSGTSGVDQLVQIMRVLGTPTREEMASMNPGYDQYRFPYLHVTPLSLLFQDYVPEQAIHFLHSLFNYDPKKRPSALESLTHSFFDELRLVNAKLPNEAPMPELFNWTPEELQSVSPEIIRKLTPSWYQMVNKMLVFLLALVSADEFCRGIALEGGGSHGAYQAGAIKALVENLTPQDVTWDIVTGVSTGAFNAAWVSQFAKGDEMNMADGMVNFWENITSDQVYVEWSYGLVLSLFLEPSIYNNAPLKKYLDTHITRGVHRNVSVAATNFQNATYVLFSNTTGSEEVIQGAFCSGSPPLFFPLCYYQKVWYADGGCLVNMDVFTAIEKCIQKTGSQQKVIVDMLYDSKTGNLTAQTEFLSLDVYWRSWQIRAYDYFTFYTYYAMQSYPNVDFRYIISPTTSQPGHLVPLDFKQADIKISVQLGYNDTVDIINNKKAGRDHILERYQNYHLNKIYIESQQVHGQMERKVEHIKINLQSPEKIKSRKTFQMPKITVSLAEPPPVLPLSCNIFDQYHQNVSSLQNSYQDTSPLDRSYDPHIQQQRKHIKRSMKKHSSSPNSREAKQIIQSRLGGMIEQYQKTSKNQLTIMKGVKAKLLNENQQNLNGNPN